jgi:hypothetical protein
VGLKAPPHPAAAMIHAAHHADACGSNPDADVKRVLGFLRHGGTSSGLNLHITVPKFQKNCTKYNFSLPASKGRV